MRNYIKEITNEELAAILRGIKLGLSKTEREYLEMAADRLASGGDAKQEPTSPCDLCRFDYMDGVCGDCPAMAKGEWE